MSQRWTVETSNMAFVSLTVHTYDHNQETPNANWMEKRFVCVQKIIQRIFLLLSPFHMCTWLASTTDGWLCRTVKCVELSIPSTSTNIRPPSACLYTCFDFELAHELRAEHTNIDGHRCESVSCNTMNLLCLPQCIARCVVIACHRISAEFVGNVMSCCRIARPHSRFLCFGRVQCWCKHPQHTFTTPTQSMEKRSMLSSACVRTHEARLSVRSILCFQWMLQCLRCCVCVCGKWRIMSVCVSVCGRVFVDNKHPRRGIHHIWFGWAK